jgi:hypothetical protein
MGNSTGFPTITHMILSAKRFRCYRILTIDVAGEFCTWAEQRQNGSSISSLGLVKTPHVLNTISVENSQLSNGLLNGSKRLVICELHWSESRQVADSAFLADHM